jgi:hypothetical protein
LRLGDRKGTCRTASAVVEAGNSLLLPSFFVTEKVGEPRRATKDRFATTPETGGIPDRAGDPAWLRPPVLVRVTNLKYSFIYNTIVIRNNFIWNKYMRYIYYTIDIFIIRYFYVIVLCLI